MHGIQTSRRQLHQQAHQKCIMGVCLQRKYPFVITCSSRVLTHNQYHRIKHQLLQQLLDERRRQHHEATASFKTKQNAKRFGCEIREVDARMLVSNSEAWKDMATPSKNAIRPHFCLYSKITKKEISALIQKGHTLYQTQS